MESGGSGIGIVFKFSWLSLGLRRAGYKNSGILFIRSQNGLWGNPDFSDAVFIDEITHKEMKRSKVKKNDVLLNITGASIGRCCIFQEEFEALISM